MSETVRGLPEGTVVRSVSEFTNGLAEWFARQKAFQNAAISGEISGLKEITNGHVTFALKERGAVLNCIVWRSSAARLPQLQNGAAIVAVGTVKLRNEFSAYQMEVDAIHLTGVGELYAKFSAIKEKLRLEGFFEETRKRTIPRYVRRVALISAEGSKASEDFLETIRAKVPFVHVVPFWTRVQGKGADIDVREAFDSADRAAVDVIVVTRGGGSYEDLFTFNEEIVVRAIGRAKHPVIAAIGHQTDHHLADDVADATYGTPSKAAEAIAAPWIATRERLAFANKNLRRAVEHALGRSAQRLELLRTQLQNALRGRASGAAQRLTALERRLNAQNPGQRLARRAADLAALNARLPAAWKRYETARANRLKLAETRLAGLNPDQPLARGFARVSVGGKLLRSARDVRPGAEIAVVLGHGSLEARVEQVRDEQ
jgi:exodeoxyribonuclease VII large subunit